MPASSSQSSASNDIQPVPSERDRRRRSQAAETIDVADQRLSESRFRAAAEANRDAFMIFEPVYDADGAICDFALAFANRAAREGALSYAFSREVDTLRDLFRAAPGGFPGALAEYVEVVRRQVATRDEKYSTADGRERWFERLLSPFGEGLVVTYRDISASKQAQLAVEAAERDQRTILENLTDGIIVTDLGADGAYRLTYVHEVLALQGVMDWQAAIGKRWDEVFDPARAAEREARGAEAVARRTSVDFEMALEDLSGRVVQLLGRVTPVFEESGSCRRLIWRYTDATEHYEARRAIEESARNLSERLAAEEAARESNDRFRQIAENATDGIVSVTRGGRIVFANPAFAAAFGFTVEELEGEPLTRLMPDDLRPRHERGFLRYSQTGKRRVPWKSLALTGRRADGSEFPLEASLSEGVQDGEPVITAFVRDVTERRRTEEALTQAQKLESLAVLAGGIAHDFNNMLVAIMGNAGLAMVELPPDSPARETIEEIEIAAQRAAELARQMLAYAGKGRVSVKALDLTSLVEEIPHLLRTSIGKGINLRLGLSRNLPPVFADATQLRQVIMNLVINASDAIGDEDGAIAVSTGVTSIDDAQRADYLPAEILPGEYVYLEVEDSGCGMTAETLARIFDPFFTTKFTGKGLGLAAVLGIVRGHHGGLKVESRPGRGTTFRVVLPTAAGAAAPVPEPAGGSNLWRGSGTVLVVDDEESVRGVASRALRTMGFETLVATDGADGLAKLAAAGDDIVGVLMDLTMPRLGGKEAALAMHEVRPNLPVVLMTGYDESEMAERFESSGFAGFIAKPFGVNQLRDVMREAVSGE